ncbi:MAG: hypothetical protein EB036_13890 [Betaproteobacteria bacterium]|nr:hypothetical protein [Betaproteobacteria bacterium]
MVSHVQKVAEHSQIPLGFPSELSVHRNTITQREDLPVTYRNTEFSVEELGFIQTALNKVLAAAARGEFDLNRLAREELAARGLDLHGNWVGFDHARKIHKLEGKA